MKKILFVSHDSSRTGAPFVLLYFLQWLKRKHPDIHLSVLALYGGDLTMPFIKVADEYWEFSKIDNPHRTFLERGKEKILKRLGIQFKRPDAKKSFVWDLSQQKFDIVYSNTVVSLPLVHQIKMLDPKVKLAVHVHELESEIKRTIGNFNQYLKNIDIVIAASHLVRENLITRHQFSEDQVKVVYEFTQKLYPQTKTAKKDMPFKVGGAGKYGHRKGTDLFIQTARYLLNNYPQLNVNFEWVGSLTDENRRNLDFELKKLNLNSRIIFVGEVEDPESYFKDFDVFLMTSREDPFPLVCIEAGMLGVPIICFDKATGIAEVIEDKGGFIVPYGSIEAMAGKIVLYIDDPELLIEHSRFNQEIFSRFTPEKKAKEIFNILKEQFVD